MDEWSPTATSPSRETIRRGKPQKRDSVASDGEDVWIDGIRQRMSTPCLGSAPMRAAGSRDSLQSTATADDTAEEEDWLCPICHEIFGE